MTQVVGVVSRKAGLVYELKECDRKEMTDVSKEHDGFFVCFLFFVLFPFPVVFCFELKSSLVNAIN